MNRRSRTIDALLFALALNLVPIGGPIGLVQSAYASEIDSLTYAEQSTRSERIDRIASFLARDAVRQQMLGLGVEPAAIEGRLSGLTDSELSLLEQRMDALPAGGSLLAVIGVVFVVLLILELVGVTNIFNKI